jgi:hypothetical protein
MRHAIIVASLTLTATLAAGCASQSAAAEPTIAYGIAASRPVAVTDGVFGEWVSQIIRTPSKVNGQPATFQGATIYDEQLRERRHMLALTLADDGTFSLITNYNVSERTIAFGTWTMTGTKIALEQNGDITWVFTSLGGKLIADKDEGPTIILGRK